MRAGRSPIGKKRLETLRDSTDGFFIAEKDLELRGQGDFFGVRQHGLPEFKIANLYTDLEVLGEASKAAEKWFSGGKSEPVL
jgi:ATP-dependent DNA helicase RecG